ncbi:MAG: substrate-binding domain-containing protein [Microcoleaceae cyanobacterium]
MPPSNLSNNTTVGIQTEAEAAQLEEVVISGSGSGYEPLKILAAAYQENNPNIQITFNPSNQTSGGVQGVKDGVIDIGSASRELKPEEQQGLNFNAYAKDLVVVSTHPSVTSVTNLTTEQLHGIYSGQITNWQEVGGPDIDILVLDRAEDETAKLLLREYYFGPDLPMSADAVILQKEKEVIETVQSTDRTIGPMSLVKAKNTALPINILSLDGIKPNSENTRNGKYQMSRIMGIIWNPNLEMSAATQDFIEFVSSPEAAEILEEAGYIPLNAPK